MRLAKLQHPIRFINIQCTVTEVHEFNIVSAYKLKSRKAAITIYRTPDPSGTDQRTVTIGYAEVDINGIVLKIYYEERAPWWAAQPFIDAMAGK